MKAFSLLFAICLFLVACGDSGNNNSTGDNTQTTTDTTKNTDANNSSTANNSTNTPPSGSDPANATGVSVDAFKQFIVKADGVPKTWVAENEDYIFFRVDGTFGGGDNTGEAGMVEGKWTLGADGLTLAIDGGETLEGIPVEIKEGTLWMGGEKMAEENF